MSADWRQRAACADTHQPELFDEPDTHHQAALICHRCPVTTECLNYGLTETDTESTRVGRGIKIQGTYGGQWVRNGRIREPNRRATRRNNVPYGQPLPDAKGAAPCGSHAAFWRHRRLGGEPCEACWQAEREFQRTRKRQRAIA